MKSVFRLIVLFLLGIGCKNGDNLTFEPLRLDGEACGDCPAVSIQIPHALGGTQLSTTINTAIKEEIIAILNYDEEVDAGTIPEAMASFKKGYLELKKLYSDETIGWEATVAGEILYEDAQLLTIALDSYIFTGGAHGYSAKRLLNFDKKKSKELENEELFKKTEDFQLFAEIKFREQENIPREKPINHTGYMFEKDSFSLPENLGFTKEGIHLHYNPYEVASYADGPITLTLSYGEVREYLAKRPKY
ncbi:MAG: DUF3298 domain-containing protein [Bacteroidota bacterium]